MQAEAQQRIPPALKPQLARLGRNLPGLWPLTALFAPAEPPRATRSASLVDLLNPIRTLSPEDRAILVATVGAPL